MSTDEAGAEERQHPGDQTTVLPETAAQLVELERLQQALAEAEERGRSHWEQYLRAVAELENVRKRAQRDIEAANRYGLEKFAAELLPVQDSLELAVQNAGGKADVKSLVQGQDATLKLLKKALERIGVVVIDPLGKPFDPARHEAMLAQESAAEPNSVLQVVQPGYEINGRLLRPARVVVAKGRG